MQEAIKNNLECRFQDMDPFEFEGFVASYFKDLGYKVEVTKDKADYGADVIAKKNGEQIAIQVKRYAKHNKSSVDDIYPLHSAKDFYNCDRAIFITTSSLTYNAKVLSQNLGVEVWPWAKFKSKLAETYQDKMPDYYYQIQKEKRIEKLKTAGGVMFWVLVFLISILFNK